MEVLRDKTKLDPEVKNYLDEENSYANYHLKDTENLQKKLFDEIKGRIKLDDESLPYKDHTYEYWSKTTAVGNYCTWNPLMSGPNAVTYKNGGRTITTGAALATCGTMAVSTGKWIVEMQLGAFDSGLWLGIWSMETDLSGNSGNDSFEPWNKFISHRLTLEYVAQGSKEEREGFKFVAVVNTKAGQVFKKPLFKVFQLFNDALYSSKGCKETLIGSKMATTQ